MLPRARNVYTKLNNLSPGSVYKEFCIMDCILSFGLCDVQSRIKVCILKFVLRDKSL
jgi:hypothetical protein